MLGTSKGHFNRLCVEIEVKVKVFPFRTETWPVAINGALKPAKAAQE